MTLAERIAAFSTLGTFLGQFSEESASTDSDFYNRIQTEIDSAVHYNGWFTKDNVLFSINQWHNALTPSNLEQWLSNYTFPKENPKTVGVIMAGNIPLVGFHDVLSVLVSGHHILIKQSSNDQRILPILLEYLIDIEPRFKSAISFVQDRMTGHDAVIATGSNNTSRYFDYYFKDVPNIIRKNRNSIAIISGEETKADIARLGDDIFRYYGLGCRNVSKLFVPKDYNFAFFFENIYHWKEVINDNKYANNYDYNKAVYLMSGANMLDNNYLLVKEDEHMSSPIGVLFYETYETTKALQQHLATIEDELQCVVASTTTFSNAIPFGHTQHPQLWDYADGVDTVDFLLKLH